MMHKANPTKKKLALLFDLEKMKGAQEATQ
jgi:hypothetical protein